MRMLWLMGCVVLISTANAQPAPSSAAPPSAAPPTAAPPPSAAPVTEAPPRSAVPPAPALSTPPLTASPATAAPGMIPATTPPSSAEPESESYRAEIVAVDAASIVLALSGNETGVKVAGLTYLLGGPIIHGLHGGGGRAGASLFMRVGMPLLGAFAGAALVQHDCSSADECDDEFPVGPIFGFGIGILSAMILDTALLAGPREAPKNTGTTWAPQVSLTPHHVGLGVVGRF